MVGEELMYIYIHTRKKENMIFRFRSILSFFSYYNRSPPPGVKPTVTCTAAKKNFWLFLFSGGEGGLQRAL